MNKKELEKHWSDQTAKHDAKSAPEPESSDPRKQKIRRKPQDLGPGEKGVPVKPEKE
jgi:hypothetical protein